MEGLNSESYLYYKLKDIRKVYEGFEDYLRDKYITKEELLDVLSQNVAISGDAINSIWGIGGYTVLLCFSLFKTSSVTKSVLGAH